jgi:phosphohistidine phosphatase
MTLTLILTRHAKSDWGDPRQADFDRPLNDRGRRSALSIGALLAARGYSPGEVIVSGARRTVETWQGIASAFDPEPHCRTDRSLYEARPEALLAAVHSATAPVTLMIGHNPGIAEFATRLAIAAPAHPRFADYPTGATTIFQFPRRNWREIGWGEGEIADFVVPRDLGD